MELSTGREGAEARSTDGAVVEQFRSPLIVTALQLGFRIDRCEFSWSYLRECLLHQRTKGVWGCIAEGFVPLPKSGF